MAGPPARPHPGHPETATRSPVASWMSSAVAVGLHGLLIATVMFFAAIHPVVEEKPLPVTIVKEPPPQPKREKSEAAPAPRALAERRNLDFAPQAQAVAPQVVNPRVVAPAAAKLDSPVGAGVVAPRAIARSQIAAAEVVSTVSTSAAAVAAPVEVPSAGAPALRGPADANLPTGASAGPRQIANSGGTIGTASAPSALGGSGSSVREGIVSGRDVVGSPTGARVSSVNTRVGESLMRGTGGEGTGSGGDDSDCDARAEVKQYMSIVRQRMIERWTLPPGIPTSAVKLEFSIDTAGSVMSVRPLGGGHPTLAASAADALRAASPFPAMPVRARCLARGPLSATFSNPRTGG